MAVDNESQEFRGIAELDPADVFTDEISDRLGAYVYRLDDPRDGATFYVGKGRGNRVFQHQRMAAGGDPGLRYDRIRAIRAAGLEPRISIHRHGLSDETAHEVEAALIDAYGTGQLVNLVSGHGADRGMMGVLDIRAAYGATPADIRVPAILIKIEQQWHAGLTDDQLYERTRRYWACRPERRPVPPTHALAVARGVIREAYEIAYWEEYADTRQEVLDPSRVVVADRAAPVITARRGFIGKPVTNEVLRGALVGHSVRHVRFGSGNPIAYVGCGKPLAEARP
ncbi:hypothetical protein EDC65_3288 [Stella humosa]|uniref:GIY-YIG domain-containing protein n=1 Tax=Stella humosa TaxID=94 RepID=A0A3N1L0G0_9PROT|nr:hypothetical protein [Stella humosa]ROP83946.1 hypothetical protein EDC65_3288 [Stella humosa]BBK33453.1 hypothetical protein STHU_40870 [Stella humosa]